MEVAQIWRHPVKSIGHEALTEVHLEAGKPMPWDRVWALAHGKTGFNFDAPEWVECGDFVRALSSPKLAAIAARYDEASGQLTLTHPERPDLTVAPATAEGAEALAAWTAPLASAAQPGPYRLAHVPGRALTDVPDNCVTVHSLSSLRALSQHVGKPLDPRRFRANIWVEGAAPWEEEDWPEREMTVGEARLRVVYRADRCRTTEANPETGVYDTNTVYTLRKTRGHIDFGVYAEIVGTGTVRVGDPVRLDPR